MNKTKRKQIKYLFALLMLITLYIKKSNAVEFNSDMLDLQDKKTLIYPVSHKQTM
ncbi:hypothetical protein SAMN05421579_1212 [Xenorhabdus japonica]|uniref:Uncharacterized protein n=1 Tax=Xenorhabdus japonica TaxID=53341 RepID=A0A1I5BQ35_9GAMM|nr:hypothetical protein SAMN05421579_1212 [Xenorhabdus japonica]